jgi:hypothetical protein
MPEAASESIKKELLQIVEMGALIPIHKKDINGQRPIKSKTFLKKKYLPNKAFEKLKARLVVRGDMQFRNPWKVTPKAPTVAQASVNMTIAIAAHQDNDIESIDITGAYLHAKTPVEDKIIVVLGPVETKFLVELFPHLQEYVLDDGTMLMLVDGAMYGMIESARYWFENICKTLCEGGYKQNPSDECVYSYVDSKGNQSIIDLWVDDLLHTYTKNCVHLKNKLRDLLIKKYKKINVKDGNEVPYCGMLLEKDTVNGGIFVSAPKFINDLLVNAKVTEYANSPTQTSFMNRYDTTTMTTNKQ